MTESLSSDELHYRGALRRIYLNTVWLTVVGTFVAALMEGPTVGLGFLLGAAVSALNFRWLHRLVDSLGPDSKKKPGKALGLFLSFRYVLFGIVGYVIVRYFKVNIMAALVGLFVAVAAVLIEVVYEIVYART